MSLLASSNELLTARVQSLKADFSRWQERTSPTGPLRQHNSQVDRIVTTLTATMATALPAGLLGAQAGGLAATALKQLPELRRSVGSVHLLWEFFRDKLSQRDVEAFEAHLGVADDLAWECYKPCLAAANTRAQPDPGAPARPSVKEPPLVFYSADRAAFAQPRALRFTPPGLDSKDIGEFALALARLPVPVIGVPCSVINRLPDLVLVGHEVGHVVAEDLGLAEEMKQALSNLNFLGASAEKRKQAWLAWSDEVFGDLFGVLATGKAFVAALGLELAGDRDDVRLATIDLERPGKYPTVALRMALCEAALTALGVAPALTWSEAYGAPVADSANFVNDIALVVPALLDRSWLALGGKTLREVLPWNAQQETNAVKVANASLNNTLTPVPFSARIWVAAAQIASQQNATQYAALELDAKLATFIVERRSDAVRSLQAHAIRATIMSDDQSEALKELDKEAGQAIAQLLGLMT